MAVQRAFRGGGSSVAVGMGGLGESGERDLTLAACSLTTCPSNLIEAVKCGEVSKVCSSG
ncbi:citrate lyase subunit alpha, partial [Vibrio cholerae]|uniref:citrate lyase subunit alpha n=1 Tax=Vibrio cholerae TaxID=666 RepID=UPI003455BB63